MKHLKEAVEKRSSRRTYQRLPLKKKDADYMNGIIERLNEESRLCMQLIEIDEQLFRGFMSGYGFMKNVMNYIAMIGDKNDPDLDDKIGYYGEIAVLEATEIGLGTCWIYGTYNRQQCERELNLPEDKTLSCIISIGYVEDKKSVKEKILSKAVKRSTKPVEELLTSSGEIPEWVRNGMESVQRAPSAKNAQPVRFVYENGEVSVSVTGAKPYKNIDLGIARLHFEIGAETGRWTSREGKWVYAVSEQKMLT